MSDRGESDAVIDWAAPWLAPYRTVGERVQARWRAGQSLAEALDSERVEGSPRFIAQAGLPAGMAYERFVAERGAVPTRDGLHDFFNGLVWLHQPALKRSLNALQAGRIAVDGVGAHRGAVRDGVTVFDENGALFEGPPELLRSLAGRDWTGLLLHRRAAWSDARVTLVGHALLEKLCRPRKPITAHVLPADTPLVEATFAARPFLPLPVLGVPGWWPGNEQPGFYDDPAVFRPGRGSER